MRVIDREIELMRLDGHLAEFEPRNCANSIQKEYIYRMRQWAEENEEL